jgi:hypothetical protein
MGDRARAFVSGPGEGRKVHVFGVVLTIRVAAADTAGDFAVWEEAAPPNSGHRGTFTGAWTRRSRYWRDTTRSGSTI